MTQTVSISGEAEQVLEQLFMGGPVHDRDIASRQGRNELAALGATERAMGFNTLNAVGLAMAVDLKIHFKRMKRDRPVTLALETETIPRLQLLHEAAHGPSL